MNLRIFELEVDFALKKPYMYYDDISDFMIRHLFSHFNTKVSLYTILTQMALVVERVVKPELIIIIIIFNDVIEIICDHVEKITDQMKSTDLDNGEQGERFVVYMYVAGSDDCITKTRLFKYTENFTTKK